MTIKVDYLWQRPTFIGAGDIPCCICGKNLWAANATHWLRIIDGGGVVASIDEPEKNIDPSADLGLYPVGKDCLKKHPELKPFVQRINQ